MKSRTVLIVDDFPQDRERYRRYLAADPDVAYTILEAASGEAGLSLCQLQPLDSILLDFQLPDLDGLQFLDRLRAQVGERYPSIVMIAGEGNESIAVKAIKYGAEDYLVKSKITPAGLQLTLKSAIENTELRLALQQTRQALEDSEKRYRAIVEDQTELICRFRSDGTLTFVNSAYSRYFDSTPEALIGQNFLHLIPESDWEMVRQQIAALNRLTPEAPILTHEHLILKPNGETGWQQWTNRAIFDAQGQIAEFQAVGQDITDRKATELSLQQANERFELAAVAVNCLIYDWDLPSNTIYRSPRLMDLLGYQPEEVGNAPQWWWQQVHPEDQARLQPSDLEQYLAQTDRYCIEYRVRHRKGQYIWVEDRGVVVKNAAGQPIRLVGSTSDISERKQAEVALQQSESLFRGVFESDLMGIVFWNIAGQITDANDAFCRLTGYSRAEMQAGQIDYLTITPPEYHERDAQKFALLQSTGQYSPIEKEYICKDGSRIPILLGCAFLPGSRDRGVAFVLDIREQKHLQQERERLLAEAQTARTSAELANRTKDEFLAVVSHELRSPLNAILGWTKLLRSRQFEAARVEQALETIERNTQAQVKLIDDLLDVSRILHGQLRLEPMPVPLAPIVNSVVANNQLAAEAKQVKLCATIDASVGLILGDINRLQQIITNLVTNAVKFTPSGGRVEVALQQRGEQAIVRVTDTGRGISPEFLPVVFELFRQADSSSTRSKEGLGLGLAIVKHLVELQGGTVQVESAGLGLGATFTATFPLIDNCVQPAMVEAVDAMGDLSQLKILVVDDMVDTCDYLQFILSECGATVEVCDSAAAAYATFQRFAPDVLLSDIGMPEEDGYSLVQRIRQLPTGQTVLAIALTAFAKPEDRERALAAGFQDYLAKPVDPTELVNLIANLSRIHSA